MSPSPQLCRFFCRSITDFHVLDQVRESIRLCHYSPRTEEAYVGWIRRFILFHGKSHPAEMEQADADDFSVFDVESAILTGKILERQREAETGEWKYVISGDAVDGRQMVVVAKFGASVQMLYILTVYAE